ncbi:MOG interacting and ectopic P-granules protein 1 isoform X1 [Onthophagus taurus]|uniref:MOG interacting and ectopic P-granules protein 1 isoform X1 n=1 Tax=Onthophagus taurus TaxID=166361 RepID=UPI0039BDB8F0
MAAVIDMGEVDDIHSKEETAKDGIILNGEVTSSKSSEKGEVENEEETMEVDNEDDVDGEEVDGQLDNNSVEIEDDEEEEDGEEEEIEEAEMEETEIEEIEEVVNIETPENNPPLSSQSNGKNEKGEIHSVDNTDDEEEDDEEDEDEDMERDDHDDVHIISEENDEDKGNIDNDKLSPKSGKKEVLNDSGDGDVVEILDSSLPKENGKSHSPALSEGPHNVDDDDDIIEIDSSPKKKTTKTTIVIGSPRRSARNLSRKSRRSYIDNQESTDEESDVEEVPPDDPLAVSDPLNDVKVKKQVSSSSSSSTIVVKDTKRLAEIASKSTLNNSGKKEPTLVIIDTNSILSGRGPIPINQKSTSFNPLLPMALPAQGVYPANMRATITPIPLNTQIKSNTQINSSTTLTSLSGGSSSTTPAILPSLTDDMFVVEAPSFIVPYVYEKPPVKDLKECVEKLKKEIIEMREKMKQEEDDEEASEEEEDVEKKLDNMKKEENDVKKVIDLDEPAAAKKTPSYFDSALGKFFMDIGHNLVQEFVQSDLLRQQKRKREREGGKNIETNKTITSLIKNLEYTKENNEPYHMKIKKCEYCSFKTESSLAMGLHLETPHMKNFVYKCNFCTYEVRSPHDILFHMEAEHNVRGRLERAPAFHQCPSCPFEDNQKGKLSRHLVACARKFKPERNMEPPIDWEPPAKIPRVPRMKQATLSTTAAMYQAMTKAPQFQLMQKMQNAQSALNRGRGRPALNSVKQQPVMRSSSSLMYKTPMAGGSVLLPTTYQVGGNPLYQVVGGQDMGSRIGTSPMTLLPNLSSTGSLTIQSAQNKSKPVHQPSISITPLPRTTGGTPSTASGSKPGDLNSKNSFVICEICDGYIKDLEQLRNHMQWIHKVKIHPKMIYNRPPLNCQKCQFRFFTDQGLERHLLGSHGLVTSSMQEAANKSKDSGRCPVCGRVYQWKLLNHVARDHNMTLKPAHLSYKCTVCTATFGMYKQFENHVYSAHSVVAKRVIDKKGPSSSSSSPQTNNSSSSSKNNDSLLKPLKINDEITIIPQLPKSSSAGSSKDRENATVTQKNSISVTATPSTSKNELSRSERLARRKSGVDH